MNAIVIVFTPERDNQLLPERAATLSIPGRDKTNFPRTAKSDQTSPPLWTWFVENPRRLCEAEL